MSYVGRMKRAALAAVLCAAASGLPVAQAQAADSALLAQMAGRWSVALVGNTSCGSTSMFATFTLNASGFGNNVSIKSNSTGCGLTVVANQPFKITNLNSRGTGKASMGCGVDCGFTFDIQVAAGGQLFALADVTDFNNNPTGTAVHMIETE